MRIKLCKKSVTLECRFAAYITSGRNCILEIATDRKHNLPIQPEVEMKEDDYNIYV